MASKLPATTVKKPKPGYPSPMPASSTPKARAVSVSNPKPGATRSVPVTKPALDTTLSAGNALSPGKSPGGANAGKFKAVGGITKTSNKVMKRTPY